MKNTIIHRSYLFIAVLATLVGINHADAQGTAFTYQGQLSNNGLPANGMYDFSFKLATSGSGAVDVGNPFLTNGVPVTNGLFITTIDFGANIFTGSNYWLQVDVRTNNGPSYVTLSPLQAVTPTPYAIMADSASNLLGALPASQLSGAFPAQLTGTIPLAQLPGAVVTNNESNVTLGSVTVSGNLVLPLPAVISDSQYSILYADQYGNLFAGLDAGNKVTGGLGGANNEAIGDSALANNTLGSGNLADGNEALYFNTTGNYNVANGSYALLANTNGSFNVANGTATMYYNTTGSSNTADGAYALFSNTVGNNNVADGYAALEDNTAGVANTADGSYALASNLTGYNNTVIGFSAMQDNASGFDNIAIGTSTFQRLTNGYQNTAVGTYACQNTVNDTGLVAIGYSALKNDNATTADGGGGFISGNGENTAVGYEALQADTTGYDNSAIGFEALLKNTTGNNNNAVGAGALNDNTIGNYNTAIGSGTLRVNTIGNNNTAIGTFSLNYNVSGSANTAIGYLTLTDNTNGSANTAIGYGALNSNPGGNQNTAIGYSSLNILTNGSDNYAMGDGAGGLLTKGSENIYIGNSGNSVESGFIRIGTSGLQTATYLTGNVYSGGTFTDTSDRNVKTGFEPVNVQTILTKVAGLPITRWQYTNDVATPHVGPMAQDFYAAFAVGPDNKHITTIDEGGVALAAIQGLNQKLNEENTQLKQQNDRLAVRLDELEAMVKSLAKQK